MSGSALVFVLSLCGLSGPAIAQTSAYSFNLPEEPLANALNDYARISGQQIIFSHADVAGKTAPALKGQYSSSEALRILLSGAGLTAERSATGGVMIRPKKAQGAQETEATPSAAVEEVTVTGTRVARSGFVTPAPTTVVTAEDLAISGNANLADTLNQLPAIHGGFAATSNPASGSYAGQSYVSLRGLGPARTLVLVDGQRFTPSTIYGPVSLNVIPQALVQRVEVVTGGASAQWGSDAIAGVVNLILDHNIEGVRATVQGGGTDHGDYQNYLVSFAAGHSFAEGRAHLTVGGEIADNRGIGTMSRDWLRKGWNVVPNPSANGTSNQPANLIVPDVRTSNASYGGLINSGPLKGIQFGPGGAPMPFNYGSYISNSTMVGGDGVLKDSIASLASPITRQTAYGRFSYDLTPNVQVYLEGGYGHSLTEGPLTLPGSAPDTSITIKNDNAFLPASVVAAMGANKVTSFTMGRWSTDYAMNIIHLEVETARVAGGLKGGFGRGWTWDVHYSYGGTNSPIQTYNNRNTARYNLAIDAVIDPKTGSPVCRSTLTNPGNGCVPMNLFGVGAPSKEALAYVMGTSFKNYDLRRAAGAATLRGEPFSTWAGPVSFATGMEYRRDSIDVTADPIAETTGWGVASQLPFSGAVTVWEGFGEAVVPLARDQRWAKELNLDLAVRETDYSTSGGATTWKVGLSYAINDSIRLRANQSHDLRAPSLPDLNQRGSSGNSNVIDRFTNQSVYIYTPQLGNASLKPETADTSTIGVVFTPSFIPHFQASIDYYDIGMKGLITAVTAQPVIDNCFYYGIGCNLLTRVNGVLTTVPSTSTNLQSARTTGVDFEMEYRIPDGEFGWNEGFGDLTVHLLGNYLGLAKYKQPGAPSTEMAGWNNVFTPNPNNLVGGPHWRFNLRGTWERGPYSVSVAGRYVGGARIVAPKYTDVDYNVLNASSRFYTDLYFQYRLERPGLGSPVFFASVQNLFDKNPPVVINTTLGIPQTDPQLYDTIGRQYSTGVRFSF